MILQEVSLESHAMARVSLFFFGGDFRSVMIWPFLRYFFGGSPRPTLELVVKTHDESYGHTWRRCPKRRENGRGFGVSHVSQRLGVFFLFDGFTSGNEGLPGWKAFLGWIFGSTARRAGEEFQVSSQELPNDASWVLTLCISKSWLQLTTFANQLGTMNQSPKK